MQRNGFGVLHQYDLKTNLAGKGVELPLQCRFLDVCSPQQVARDLTADIGMNVAQRYRVSVHDNGVQA